MTVDARLANFDDITVEAYSKDISDETLLKISNSAPKHLSPKAKVRYMEVMAASLPLQEEESVVSNKNDSHTDQVAEENADKSEKPQGDQVKWSHEAVLLLISVKQENANLFSSHLITQKQAWRKVAEEMCQKGQIFSGEDCDKKFRSLKLRYKIIKERNNKTGSDRHSWKYFDLLDEMFRGDPAVQPVASASSLLESTPILTTPTCTSPRSSGSTSSTVSNEKHPSTLQEHLPEGNLSSPSPPPLKKRRLDREPSWVSDYRTELREMHNERMALDREKMKLDARRVSALEKLVELMPKQ